MTLADTWMHGGVGWGWMALMMVVMVLFWAAVIFGIVWLIREGFDRRSTPPPTPQTESPTEILERRFAEGALSVEDYRARREVLVHPASASNGARKDEQLVAPR